jgi:nucleotide-binding universal stress UspA family protein
VVGRPGAAGRPRLKAASAPTGDAASPQCEDAPGGVQEMTMYKRILIPTDGSEITGRAIDSGVGLAKALGAEIDTICVKEPFPYGAVAEMQPTPPQEFFEAQERAAARNVGAVIAACEAAGVICHAVTVEGLQPWEAIIEHAEKSGCDLLVMGSHGRGGLASLFLGSEMQDVLKHTRIPVLVVR